QIPYAKWSAAPSIVSDVTLSSSYMATKLEDAYETICGSAKVCPLPLLSPVQQQQQVSIVAKTAKIAFAATNAAIAAAAAGKKWSKKPTSITLEFSHRNGEQA
ncbi:hypothetical protein HK100_004949, partial [Physocladia obscura]